MAGLSQRSVAQMIRVFEKLGCYDDNSYTGINAPLLSASDLKRELYARDFPRDFLDICERQFLWDFDRLLPQLYDGHLHSLHPIRMTVTEAGEVETGRQVLLRFGEYLFAKAATLPNYDGWHEELAKLRNSLDLDGFRLLSGKLIPADTAVFDWPKQVSLLVDQVKAARLRSEEVVLHHFTNGEQLYVSNKFDTALGEWRKFFERLLRDTAEVTAQNRPDLKEDATRLSMKKLFPYLGGAGFFDPDEQLAFSSSWGFLCSGSHPGIGEKDQAYLGMVLALTFGHVLLRKYVAWKAQGFRGF